MDLTLQPYVSNKHNPSNSWSPYMKTRKLHFLVLFLLLQIYYPGQDPKLVCPGTLKLTLCPIYQMKAQDLRISDMRATFLARGLKMAQKGRIAANPLQLDRGSHQPCKPKACHTHMIMGLYAGMTLSRHREVLYNLQLLRNRKRARPITHQSQKQRKLSWLWIWRIFVSVVSGPFITTAMECWNSEKTNNSQNADSQNYYKNNICNIDFLGDTFTDERYLNL